MLGIVICEFKIKIINEADLGERLIFVIKIVILVIGTHKALYINTYHLPNHTNNPTFTCLFKIKQYLSIIFEGNANFT